MPSASERLQRMLEDPDYADAVRHNYTDTLDRLRAAEAALAAVPWESIAYAALHADLAHIATHGNTDPNLTLLFAWINANGPQGVQRE